MKTRFAMIGNGGVGAYFGLRMHLAGLDVTFITTPRSENEIQRNGLTILSGDTQVQVTGFAGPGEWRNGPPFDVLFVSVKIDDLASVCDQLAGIVHEESIVVPLLNGVEAVERIAAAVGPRRVLGGSCRIVAERVERTVIRHVGFEPTLLFGEPDGWQSDRVRAIHTELASVTGVTCIVPEDIQAIIWQKFLFITSFGAVGAATGATAGTLRSVPEAKRLMERLLEELFLLAQAEGVRMTEPMRDGALEIFEKLPPESTASMQRAWLAGRPSELKPLLESALRIAQRHRQTVPICECLYRVLLPAELQARQMIAGTSRRSP